jgi:hypothetical protein
LQQKVAEQPFVRAALLFSTTGIKAGGACPPLISSRPFAAIADFILLSRLSIGALT